MINWPISTMEDRKPVRMENGEDALIFYRDDKWLYGLFSKAETRQITRGKWFLDGSCYNNSHSNLIPPVRECKIICAWLKDGGCNLYHWNGETEESVKKRFSCNANIENISFHTVTDELVNASDPWPLDQENKEIILNMTIRLSVVALEDLRNMLQSEPDKDNTEGESNNEGST